MYFYGPTNGYYWGWGIVMGIIWLIFFIVIIYAIIRLFKHHNLVNPHLDDPLDIAKLRYAKGEITKEQFEQIKKDLK
jgi:putative membrane protein